MSAIKDLSIPQKRAIAQALVERGYSVREIGSYLSVSYSSVSKWSKKTSSKGMRAFASEFLSRIDCMKNTGLIKALIRLEELIPLSDSIADVVKAAEFLEGRKASMQTNVQLNFSTAVEKTIAEYGEI